MESFFARWKSLVGKLNLQKRKRARLTAYTRRLHFEQFENRRMLAVFTVNSPLDNTIGDDGLTTLREAINAANQQPDQDTIDFSTAPADGLDGGRILLTQGQFTGQLTIFESVTIDATMLTAGITIDASGNDPTPDSTLDDGIPENDGDGTNVFLIFSFGAALDVTLAGLKITGGDSSGSGGGVRVFGQLGVVALEIVESTISGNAALAYGGGIYVNGSGATVEVVDTIISGNTSQRGGGLYAKLTGDVPSAVTIDDSTISGNTSFGTGSNEGGGGVSLKTRGTEIQIVDTIISGNTSNAADRGGGGLYAYLEAIPGGDPSTLTIERSTIAGNTSQAGGGGISADFMLAV